MIIDVFSQAQDDIGRGEGPSLLNDGALWKRERNIHQIMAESRKSAILDLVLQTLFILTNFS